MIEIQLPAGKAGHILVVDGLLESGFVSRAYEDLLAATHRDGQPGRTMGGVMMDMKNCIDYSVPRDHWAFLTLQEALRAGLAIYRSNWNELDNIADLHTTGFLCQTYPALNGFYRPHVDATPLHDPFRVMAPIIYLNDVDQGGETHFIHHDVKVQPKAGRVVFFPACWTHLHTGLLPLSGDKTILTTFMFVGPNPEEMIEYYQGHVNELRQRHLPPQEEPEATFTPTPAPPPPPQNQRS